MSNDKNALVAAGDAISSRTPSDDPLAVLRTAPPLLVEPMTLIEGFRHLQDRIPDFTQLSPEEVRSMMRLAYLDPQFLEKGVQVASVWEHTEKMAGRSAEELSREAELIRQWDQVELELTVVLKGIAAANLKRKYHLGMAVLKIYNCLRHTIDGPARHLRPYFDDLKRAYLRRRKKPAKAAAETKTDTAEE